MFHGLLSLVLLPPIADGAALHKNPPGDGIAGTNVGELNTVHIVGGLTWPLHLAAAPGDYDRLFIVEQRDSAGIDDRADIRIYKYSANALNDAPFFTITGITFGFEQGLFSIAFHPEYENNGLFFVNYTTGDPMGGTTVIARYQVSSDPDLADMSSAMVVLEIAQPQGNHNGGWMAFGPDGCLYIATGDGGGGFDSGPGHIEPTGNAQSLESLHGKILRIDVSTQPAGSEPPYFIPPSNPYANEKSQTIRKEIWALGLRNPWRPGFDRLTGDLYIADVGQGDREEVSFQPASFGFPGDPNYHGGRNYGWRCMEGDLCTGFPGGPDCVCFGPNIIHPFHVYDHTAQNRCSITGGFVYRGSAIPALQGTYFYADFCANRVWSLRYDGANVSEFQDRTAELQPGGGHFLGSTTSFGEDNHGELYIVRSNSGDIFKIVRDCQPDLTANGTVNVDDLLMVINNWGTCPPQSCPPQCVADVDSNCIVNVNDLLGVINGWGPCQ